MNLMHHHHHHQHRHQHQQQSEQQGQQPAFLTTLDFSTFPAFPGAIARTVESEFARLPPSDWQPKKSGARNFTKTVRWSPDGTCLLSNSEDNVLRLFEFPSEAVAQAGLATYWKMDDGSTPSSSSAPPSPHEWSPVLRIQETSTIYDYDWYPYMQSSDPATCCLLSTACRQPVHLWDAFTGKLRASYTCLDQYFARATAISCAFNATGERIYCGLDKRIVVFDTSRPGREHAREIYSRDLGHGGIISCFAFSTHDEGLFAAGSYASKVGLYREGSRGIVHLFEGHTGGITQVLFSPAGHLLFTGARKDNGIFCWDLRYMHEPLFRCERNVRSNQRFLFDIDSTGSYLVSGGQDGEVVVLDIAQNGKEIARMDTGAGEAVNAAVFHPTMPVIATSTGERELPSMAPLFGRKLRRQDGQDDGSSSDSDDDDDDDSSSSGSDGSDDEDLHMMDSQAPPHNPFIALWPIAFDHVPFIQEQVELAE